MNIIFISPNYPEDRWRYIHALRGLGVNVLGIGDAGEEYFPHGLKGCLTDYYKVDDLHDYDAVYRAVSYFAYQYGRPDGIESLNDYWATLEASLRRDFNVVGFDADYARRVFDKNEVRRAAASAGVMLMHRDEDGEPMLPEGARVIRCCGMVNRYGKVTGVAAYEFSDLPERILKNKELLSFFSLSEKECETADSGFMNTAMKVVDAVRLRGGFFNLTFAVGESIWLCDASFLPPEEYFADVLACTGSSDVCHLWAADKVGMNMDYHILPETTVFVTRRFDRSYRYSHDRIMGKLTPVIRRYGRSYTDTGITGDYFYIFKADNAAKARELIRFIQVDYADSSPIEQFPPLKAVERDQLRQTAIREQSSVEARMLLNRKVEEKIRHSANGGEAGDTARGESAPNADAAGGERAPYTGAYEEARSMAGTSSVLQ